MKKTNRGQRDEYKECCPANVPNFCFDPGTRLPDGKYDYDSKAWC